MTTARDTIFALSSGRPPAAIAVVRISGPEAGSALIALSGRLPEPRRAALARVRDPATGDAIDEALALWFPGPASETGEDVVELQLHGGRAVVTAVFAALERIDRLRPAEAGEFTRRAFENGKLDLTAVEGLADLIAAETEAQRRQAYRQLKGLLGDRAVTWRARLIQALALVEARIDFSDEADVPEELVGPALAIASELQKEIGEALAGARRGERLRDGLVVAIAGPPNAGKSTLFNRIARREAAIVSPIPGTTRDVIEVHLDLHGYPVTLLDTAGIRESADAIEQEGVRRAVERAADADLVLWVEDSGASDHQAMAALPSDSDRWRIWNKSDLHLTKHNNDNRTSIDYIRFFRISSLVGDGIDGLLDALGAWAETRFEGEAALVTRARQRRLLEDASSALGRALIEGPYGREDIIAEDLRTAATSLGKLTGHVGVEDVLDRLFRDFCIGK